MGSGEQRLTRIGDIPFRGRVGENVAKYAKANQDLGRDLASELSNGAEAARRAMRGLQGHPLLHGVDVRLRARRVARKLNKAKELALAVSAESVRFNQQYRREFLDVDDRKGGKGKKDRRSNGVDL